MVKSSRAARGLAKAKGVSYNPGAFQKQFGAWLSPVERTVRVREVVGSNPAAPTNDYHRTHGYSKTGVREVKGKGDC